MTVFPKIFDLLKSKARDDMIVVAGGVMPDEDVAALKEMGVKRSDAAGHAARRPSSTGSGNSSPSGAALSAWRTGPSRRLRRGLLAAARTAATGSPSARRCPLPTARRAILERLQEVCAYAYEHAPFYRRKWDEAGFHPSQLRSLEDFEEGPGRPEKGSARRAGARIRRSATISACRTARCSISTAPAAPPAGRPPSRIGRNDWRAIANAHARIMWGMGIAPGRHGLRRRDLQPLHGKLGRACRRGAARRARLSLSGRASPGMTARCAQWLDLMKPTAFYGTPSYALHLAESRRRRRPRSARFRPARSCSSPASRAHRSPACATDRGSLRRHGVRLRLDGRDDAVDERRRSPRRRRGMLCWQDVVYTEVCDPATMRRVPYGQRGTPVYTHLERTSQPMIRLRPGDLTAVDRRAEPVRPHLSAAAAGHFRPHRRHVHDPRRERLSERDRRGAERAARLRRRAPHRHQPRSGDGRACCCGSSRCRDLSRRAPTPSRLPRRASNTASRRCSACAPRGGRRAAARSRAPTSRRAA